MSDEIIYLDKREDNPYGSFQFNDLPRTLALQNKDGKTLTLDFTGDKVVTSGDLPMDEATKIFVDWISQYFYSTFVERKKVKEVIENFDVEYMAPGCVDTEETKKRLLEELERC